MSPFDAQIRILHQPFIFAVSAGSYNYTCRRVRGQEWSHFEIFHYLILQFVPLRGRSCLRRAKGGSFH
jgi:hypothetical protein